MLRFERAVGVRLVVNIDRGLRGLTDGGATLIALGFTELGSAHPDVRTGVQRTEQQHHDDRKDDRHLLPLLFSMCSTRHEAANSHDDTFSKQRGVERDGALLPILIMHD